MALDSVSAAAAPATSASSSGSVGPVGAAAEASASVATGPNGSAAPNGSTDPNSASGSSVPPGSTGTAGSTGTGRGRGSGNPSGASCGDSPVGAPAADAAKLATGSRFLQLLTKTAAGTRADARIDPKAVGTGARTRPARDEAAPADTDCLVAALALMCPAPPVIAGPAPAAARPDDSASTSGTGAAAATAAVGASQPGPAAPAHTGSDVLSIPDLMALLTTDATKEGPSGATQAASAPAAAADRASGAATGAAADATAAPGPPASNPHLGAMAHFAVHHNAAESPRADVKSPVGTSAWADELGGKITWMAHQGIESASLRLSPEHLGPVEVQISVQSGATSVVFGAAHADTRAALEQALPRLRAMFTSQGLTLTDAGVSREPPKQSPRSARIAAISAVSPVSNETVSVSASARLRLGLLDTYA